MDIVLGVSMAPSTIRMVLVEGDNADGVTVEEDQFDVAAAATLSSSDQVISAILGTREAASAGGYRLASTGVTWTNPVDAAALREALAARKIENVMLVSAFLAAAALTQTVGQAIGYQHTAMLFVEPQTATLAVVDASDGSVTDVYRRPLRSTDLAGELAAMVADLDGSATRPDGLFVVGCGVDIAPIKPVLETATWLPVSAPEEPGTALARGAALASANAPLFASSTAALAYAQDPGTGRVDPYAVAPGYLDVPVARPGAEIGDEDIAYSAVADDDGDADTTVLSKDGGLDEPRSGRRPLLLVGSGLAVVFVIAALALEVALALGIRPTVALLPNPVQNLIVPTEQPPAPPAPAASQPQPQAVHMTAPPAPATPPAPVDPVVAPQPLAVPAPAPPPLPDAAPVPVPVPVPVRVPLPAPPIHVAIPRPVQAPIAQPPLPPVHLPTPPLHLPTPPANPPTPPVHIPTPPVQAPTPPIQFPKPPAHVPTPPPWQLPTPPLQDPAPPIQLPTPPVNMPAPEPPMRLPVPQAPQFPRLPTPQTPRLPTLTAPQFPRMPAPAAPAMPHFNFPTPSFRF